MSTIWSPSARSPGPVSARRRLTSGTWSTPRLLRLSSTAGPQLLGPLGEPQRQRSFGVGGGADLADDEDVVLGAQRLPDDLVGEAVPVELGGVDVVDAQLDGAAQQRDGRGAVRVQAGQLHRAESDTRDVPAEEPSGAAGARGAVRGDGGGRGSGGRGSRRRRGRGHGNPASCEDRGNGGTSVTSKVAQPEEPPLCLRPRMTRTRRPAGARPTVPPARTRAATARDSSPPPVPPSPGTTRRWRWRRSPARRGSASAPSTGTSPPVRPSSRPSTPPSWTP